MKTIALVNGLFQIPATVLENLLKFDVRMETVTSNYVGEIEQTIFSLTKVGNEAVEKGSIHVMPTVELAIFLPRFNASADQLQTRQATPTVPSDSYTYDERSITPLDAMFYDEFNPRTYEDVWRPFQPTGPLVDRVSNPKILAAIIEETMLSVGTQIGKLIWQGDTAAGGGSPLRFFDGFLKILQADGAISPTPAGVITDANVISVLEATEAAIPATIWGDANVMFHVSTADFRLYQAAARALDFKGTDIANAMEQRFAGREIRHYKDMKKDFIIVAKSTAGKDSNLWAGVANVTDEENVKIARLQANSELFFAKVLFKYAVNSPNPTETVVYKPA